MGIYIVLNDISLQRLALTTPGKYECRSIFLNSFHDTEK